MVTQKVQCKLTDDELAERSQQLVELLGDRRTLAEEAKESAAGYRDRLKAIDKDVDGLLDQLTEGVEQRELEVEEMRDERRGEIVTRRADTGEEIDRRAMTAEERQGDLFGGAGDEPADDVPFGEPTTYVGSDGQPLVEVPKAKRRRAKRDKGGEA